jgi:hypothetical protein
VGTRRRRIVSGISRDLLRKRHADRKRERERKEKKGLHGNERGKNAAALDAAGAGLGSFALALFGAVMWFLAQDTATGSFALATLTWFAVAVLLWRVRRQACVPFGPKKDPR